MGAEAMQEEAHFTRRYAFLPVAPLEQQRDYQVLSLTCKYINLVGFYFLEGFNKLTLCRYTSMTSY
jgi:hypothetical protein